MQKSAKSNLIVFKAMMTERTGISIKYLLAEEKWMLNCKRDTSVFYPIPYWVWFLHGNRWKNYTDIYDIEWSIFIWNCICYWSVNVTTSEAAVFLTSDPFEVANNHLKTTNTWVSGSWHFLNFLHFNFLNFFFSEALKIATEI